jgi:hypothetical protein
VQDLKKKVTGSVYPAAGNNTGACPGPTCGVLQSGYPMPWADTGLSSPNNFTNSAGVLNYTSGTVTTTLNGKYAKITDECGAISESSSTGTLDLGGSVGADCLSTGSSLGDTNASRTVYYELNKVAEIGRGWLPNNNWLKAQQTATVNRNTLGSCGAFWNGTQFFFDRTVPRNQSCQMCNNPGQTASVIDHEWGHGLDNNDATPNYGTRFSEGFADIAAIYRQQQSCIGYGQRTVPQCDTGDPTTCDVADPPACPQRCGTASDGNPNAYEDYPGGPNPNKHCTTDCSGARDADWRKHADGVPDTPQNFVCSTCPAEGGTPGPCGKDIYCGAAPMRQAAWDLAAFDLQSSPFSFDSKTAFVIASRLFHVGSGNTTSWHSCDCVAGTSDGCGAASGYKQWLAADDDNGNLNDGTPHMTAIYNAFNRHNIACSTPTVQNHGCQDAPSGIPTLTATAGSFSSALTWTSVSGAAKYFVFRTEGHNGCDLGRALIAQPTSASYTDTEVAAGRQYCYSVAAAGGLSACFARLSTCQCVTPVP